MRPWWSFGLVLAACAWAWPALAGTGETLTLPQVPKPKSGLKIVLDGHGVDGNGYRPIRVTVSPLNGKPWAFDRQIRLVIVPRCYYNQHSPRVSQTIDLPEGGTSVSTSIAVPQAGVWHSLDVQTYENGRLLRDLSQEGMDWQANNAWDWTESRPSLLLIDADVPPRPVRKQLIAALVGQGSDPMPTHDLPDFRALTWLFPDPNRGGGSGPGGAPPSDTTLLAQADEQSRLNLEAPGDLPNRWIELSQYDVAIVSLADLQASAKSHPQRAKALADWAATGPVLIVHGVGKDFAELASLERLLELAPLATAAEGDDNFRGWDPANNTHHLERLTVDLDNEQRGYPYYRRQRGYPPGDEGQGKPGGETITAPPSPPFAIRPIGLGKLVAIAADDPFAGTTSDWIWIFNSIPERHWTWRQRNGYSLHRKNDDYWQFLIPGVGQAPVVSFLLLVSVFAVLIGPVNYMFLSRVRRLYLLLLTVPAGALLVTGALFVYALATDGLGVRLRARSFTELDQRSGRAVAWSRQSYYAALAPSRGLDFPADATVFPIEPRPENTYSDAPPKTHLVWEEDQNLRDHYLASRTTTQYMVARATRATQKLAVKLTPNQPPRVVNELGTNIEYVLLRDREGNYWSAEALAAGDGGPLAAADLPTAADKLRKLYGRHPLELPANFHPDQSSGLDWLVPGGFSGFFPDGTDPWMEASLLESQLARAAKPVAEPLDPHSYVAVVERSPLVPYGVPRVREEASLHVLRGRW
ncbi:MAG: hypothetical protein SFU86_21765 [Pirellulaceae bacterium]|nr:hypothetical protein [Pirellulaceae bacterium]